jgi:hypothetical protein
MGRAVAPEAVPADSRDDVALAGRCRLDRRAELRCLRAGGVRLLLRVLLRFFAKFVCRSSWSLLVPAQRGAVYY